MPRGYLKVFQYGSNMNAERLNCPERLNGKARVVGVARLEGYGIRFDLYSQTNKCGVTHIVRAANEHVLPLGTAGRAGPAIDWRSVPCISAQRVFGQTPGPI